MSVYPEDIAERASTYAAERSLRLEDQLGAGVDGIVFRSDRPSAVKVFARQEGFRRELACYHRLRLNDVLDVGGHNVPQLLEFDDSLLVIEMTVVNPPFLLDFAGAYVNAAPDFPDEVMEQWHAESANNSALIAGSRFRCCWRSYEDITAFMSLM